MPPRPQHGAKIYQRHLFRTPIYAVVCRMNSARGSQFVLSSPSLRTVVFARLHTNFSQGWRVHARAKKCY